MKFKKASPPSDDMPRRRLSDAPAAGQRAFSAGSGAGQFRRNQTLSGIVRDPDTGALSERQRAHILAKRRRKIGLTMLVVLGVIVFLVILLSQLTARVTLAGSSEPLNRPVDATVYEERINEYLAQNPVQRLRFALNIESMTAFVADRYPEVAELEISGVRDFIDTQITVTFRQPIAGWQINNQQSYVDTVGVVFQNNYYGDPGVQIIDETGISPQQGATVASARLLSFVGVVVAGIEGQGRQVTEVRLPPDATRQVNLRLDGVQPFIRMSIDRAAGEQISDMTRSLSFLESRGITAEYVDVRVAGRAVYR